MNTKFTKTKSWIKNHKEDLQAAGVMAGIAAVYVGVCVLAVKAYNKELAQQEEIYNTLADACTRGASVLPSPTGFWIIENQ